jgi:hypothetical protein
MRCDAMRTGKMTLGVDTDTDTVVDTERLLGCNSSAVDESVNDDNDADADTGVGVEGAEEEEDNVSSAMGETLSGCCWSTSEGLTQTLIDEADEDGRADNAAKSGIAAETETTTSGRRNGAGCGGGEEGDEECDGSQLDAAEELDDGVEERAQKPDECRIWCTAQNSFLEANKRTATPVSTYVAPSCTKTY